jgi:hypothetical protein
MVSVKGAALPTGRISSVGASVVTVGGAVVTVPIASTVLAARGPAVTVIVPGRIAVRGIGTDALPAGTVTAAGRLTIPAGLLVSGTDVLSAGAAFRVRVRIVEAPTSRVTGFGVSPASVGGGGRTATMADWPLPFKGPAVSVAVPRASAATGTGTAH